MSDLIVLNDDETDRLYSILPEPFTEETVKRLYREPSLASFRVELHHKNGTLSQYTFAHLDEDFSRETPDGVQFTMKAHAATACAIRCFDTDDKLLVKVFAMSGCNENDELTELVSQGSYLHPSQPQGYDEMHEYCIVAFRLYEQLQYLLLHHQECLSFSIKYEPSKHSGKRKKAKVKKVPPKKVRVYHLKPMDDETIERIKRTAKAQRTCLAWGVRGHYRHCKSGKIVYVKPHIKGKQKDLYRGREYSLIPNKALKTTDIT